MGIPHAMHVFVIITSYATSHAESAEPVNGVFAHRDRAFEADVHVLAGLEGKPVPVETQNIGALTQVPDMMNAVVGPFQPGLSR